MNDQGNRVSNQSSSGARVERKTSKTDLATPGRPLFARFATSSALVMAIGCGSGLPAPGSPEAGKSRSSQIDECLYKDAKQEITVQGSGQGRAQDLLGCLESIVPLDGENEAWIRLKMENNSVCPVFVNDQWIAAFKIGGAGDALTSAVSPKLVTKQPQTVVITDEFTETTSAVLRRAASLPIGRLCLSALVDWHQAHDLQLAAEADRKQEAEEAAQRQKNAEDAALAVTNRETAFKTSVEKCKASWNTRECALPELSEIQRRDCKDACLDRMDVALADEERSASNRCAEDYVKSGGKTGTACTLHIPSETSITTPFLDAAKERCSMTCSDEAPTALKKAKLGPRLERETANIKTNYRLCMVNAWHSVPRNYKADRGLRAERMTKATESCRKQMGCDDFEQVTGEACDSDLAWTADPHQ